MNITALFPRYTILCRIRLNDFIYLFVRNFISDPVPRVDREHVFFDVTERHGRLIAGICLSFAESKEDFEDLRQDVLLNIWRGLRNFRNESSGSTWIYRVTLNTCVSFSRKARRKDEISMNELYAELYDTSSIEDIERYRIMYDLVGKLKPVDRSVMLMWLQGKTYEEISAVVGLSRDGVASRLKRARDRLSEIYHNNR